MIRQIHQVLVVVLGLVLVTMNGVESRRILDSFEYSAISCRSHCASIVDFGGVGDGETLNTQAFQTAVYHLSQYASDGGAQLFVPSGKWLTGSFNLTSHFTLYLHKDAVLLASQVNAHTHTKNKTILQVISLFITICLGYKYLAVIDPLPLYGHRRNAAGGRYISLLFRTNLTDVVVMGENGSIDGQGALWWQQFHSKKLKYTRPCLIEISAARTWVWRGSGLHRLLCSRFGVPLGCW